jgi:HK97 family phage prohead protease
VVMPKQHLLVSDPDKRIVAGFASVEVKDLQNDIVPVSVLERAMYDFMERGGTIIYCHTNMPIGKVLRWEIRKHPDTGKPGLWIEAEIYKGVIPADQLWEEIKAGKVLGFSIGGVGKEEKVKIKSEDGKEEEADLVTFLQLLEISIVEEPANPHARIEYVNYMAKGNDDFSRCLNEAGKDEVDFCKWVSAVYRDYGFDDVAEAVKSIMSMLEAGPERKEGKPEVVETAKAEGPVTTETPGAYNPAYGDKPASQVNLEEADPGDEAGEEAGEPFSPGQEQAPGEERSEEEKEIIDLISRLVGELRELLDAVREVVADEDEEDQQE